MSLCICPDEGVRSDKFEQFVADFLKGLAPDGSYGDSGWSFLSLIDMARAGNSLSTISEVVPFRGGACPRSLRCCSSCARRCKYRCIQDCLHRLYMWRSIVDNTPPERQNELPLDIRLIAHQKFVNADHLRVVVGDLVQHEARKHPGSTKLNYEPSYDVDSQTGRRKVDKDTGFISILEWPQSGLCPYCLPRVTVDGRTVKANARKAAQELAK